MVLSHRSFVIEIQVHCHASRSHHLSTSCTHLDNLRKDRAVSLRSLCHSLPSASPRVRVGAAVIKGIVFTSKWFLRLSLMSLLIWKKGRFMIISNATLCFKFRLNYPVKFSLKGQELDFCRNLSTLQVSRHAPRRSIATHSLQTS